MYFEVIAVKLFLFHKFSEISVSSIGTVFNLLYLINKRVTKLANFNLRNIFARAVFVVHSFYFLIWLFY